MHETDESALVEQAKAEPKVFGEIYRHYVRRIYNYHYRHTSNRVDAEDLTSRTFHKALRNLHRYQDKKGASFQSWLFRIAHNLVVNWYRDASRHPEVSMTALEPLTTERGNPSKTIEKAEERAWLLSLVDNLPEDRKTLIILKFVEQMTNAEIGEVLGKTEGAIKALYYRTLSSLRETVAEGE
jgi:RNA polymerase sigma-70 factor, ECF subfamily